MIRFRASLAAAVLLPISLQAGDWETPLASAGPSTESPSAQAAGPHFGFAPLQFVSNMGATSPGLLLGTTYFNYVFDADYDTLPGDVKTIEAGLIAPVLPVSWGDFRFIGMVNYRYNHFDSSVPTLLPDGSLHAIRLPLVGLYDLSNRWLLGGMVMPSWAGDFNQVGDSFSVTSVVAAAYHFNDRFKGGFGVLWSHGFGDDLVLPGVGFLWRPREDLMVTLFPPLASVTYKLGENWLIGLNGRYDTVTWNVEADAAGPQRDVKVSGFRLGARVERRVYKRLWAYAAGGISLGRELDVETTSGNNTLIEDDLGSSAYLSAGMNLRF